MAKYINNFTGHKWTESRKLTTELLNQFNKDVKLNGHAAWKSFADPNGPYSPIKQRIIDHNHEVRSVWDSGVYNRKERVLEGFADYAAGKLRVQHVDIDTAVKEKAFYSKEDRFSVLQDDDSAVRIFGDSELSLGTLDRFVFPVEGVSTYFQFCQYIDEMTTALGGLY